MKTKINNMPKGVLNLISLSFPPFQVKLIIVFLQYSKEENIFLLRKILKFPIQGFIQKESFEGVLLKLGNLSGKRFSQYFLKAERTSFPLILFSFKF